jgi:hypothetical protein
MAQESSDKASVDIATDATGSTLKLPTAAIQSTPASDVRLPSSDLKPLFDYVQDCRACEAENMAERQDAADEATKLAAVTHERDAALKAAAGGSVWHRIRRDLEWLAAGAVGGYIAGHL